VGTALSMAGTELPELGPLFGRLLAPPGEHDRPGARLDAVRVELVSVLFDAAGRARESLARGDHRAAGIALAPAVWLTAWERAVAETAGLVVAEAEARLRQAALRSRSPARRLHALLPDPEYSRVLQARLAAAGSELELAAEAAVAEGMHSHPDAWPAALRRIGGELEAAWERVSQEARSELAAWELRARALAAWRRPLRPVLLGAVLLLAAAIWLGLVLGGYLAVPGWLRPFADWAWSLRL